MKSFILALLFCLSSCYLKHYPVTFNVADDGTYKIITSEHASGTAWTLNKHHLITAGHVCDSGTQDYVLMAGDGRKFNAKSVQWEKGETSDLCLLETTIELSTPLIIADEMPKVGDDIKYVGYPLGKYSRGEGKYLGDVDGPDETENDYTISAPCDHGVSGSAVFTEKGVWGVLTHLRTDGGYVHEGSEGCGAIPLYVLRQFIESTGESYDSPPEAPRDPFTKIPGTEHNDPLKMPN